MLALRGVCWVVEELGTQTVQTHEQGGQEERKELSVMGH